jgi:hypothetical protein
MGTTAIKFKLELTGHAPRLQINQLKCERSARHELSDDHRVMKFVDTSSMTRGALRGRCSVRTQVNIASSRGEQA